MNAIKAVLLSLIIVSFNYCGMGGASDADIRTLDSLSTVLNEKEKEITNNLDLLDHIDAALKEANLNGNLEVKDPEKVKAIDKEIFDKIASLRKKLEADNIEIEKLTRDLNKAKESASYRKDLLDKVSGRLEKYEKENALMKQQIARETQDISNLTAELEAQGIQISQLKSTLSALNKDIVELKAELNLGYFLIGTKKELKHNNIIAKKGVGGAITLNEKLDYSKFMELDKSNDTSIRLTGFKKVVLVPERPVDSYKIITKDNLAVKIKITNSDKFWEVSNYLVVVVK